MTRRRALALLAGVSLLALGCRRKAAGEGTVGLPIAPMGPQVLAFRGNVYNIIATYYLKFPDGLQYTMEYQVPASVEVIDVTEEQAYELAYPLMRGALEQHWHERTKIERIGGPTPDVTRIGMVLYTHESRSRGRRLSKDIKTVMAGP